MKTTRRHLLQTAAAGGVTVAGLGSVLAARQKPGQGNEHAHDNRLLSGNRAHVVVGFGQWEVDLNDLNNPPGPVDRGLPGPPPAPNRNVHKHLPFEAEVDAGGAVSFTISGLHQVLIYANRDLASVQAAAVATPTQPDLPAIPPLPVTLVNYGEDRVYRGLDPRTLFYMTPGPGGVFSPNLVLDRIESVNFFEPGRYLVVCGVRFHFDEGMHGYVNVKA
jgi:hypothetical protein